MIESTRPPGFRKPAAPPSDLYLYFGYDDYVVASCAESAAALWMEYFDAEGADPKDFEPLQDDELVQVWLNMGVGSHGAIGSVVASPETIERGSASLKELPARDIIACFGPGYVASTGEGD